MRQTQETLTGWCVLPTPLGDFRIYDSGDDNVRVVSFGDLRELGHEPLVRIHSSCLASEVFGAGDCDCADQLRASMKLMATEGRGLIFHLNQEGRGHGLSHKIKAVWTMQKDGLDTVEAFERLGLDQDIRSYDTVVEILSRLEVSNLRLITNNPRKANFLQQRGIRVQIVPTHPNVRPENADYLETKRAKLGHLLILACDETTGPILFYHSDQPWGEFSNFSRHSVFLKDRIWPTVEHYYQAQKFGETSREELIRRLPTSTLAKVRANEWVDFRRHDWSQVKESVMLDGLRAKFTQHPELLEKLSGTGARELVEHTGNDDFWGDGGDGRGQNRLGHLLMQVREELSR